MSSWEAGRLGKLGVVVDDHARGAPSGFPSALPGHRARPARANSSRSGEKHRERNRALERRTLVMSSQLASE